jgi:tetratricopeptide (TPR) repeat protein
MPVDCRADVYSLGVLLAALLGLENGSQATLAGLRKINARVTQGLADLVGRCVASNPADRYRSAAELGADLRRHLGNQPLRGVANRSMLERWCKWRRRRPLALPLFVAVITGIFASACWVGHVARQTRAAENALQQGDQHLARQHFGAALEAFHGGAALAEGLPFNGELLERLQHGARQADQGRAAGELHKLCERVRAAYAANDLTADQARDVEDHCRSLWEQRERIVERLCRQTDHELDQQVKSDLLDLAILWADLHARAVPASDARASRAEALAVLAEAEALLGPSCVLARERLMHALVVAQPEIVAAATRQCAELPPRGAWEHYALGRALLRSGDLRAAAEQLDVAVELTPQSLWPNFTRGLCAFRAGRYEDALAAFSACAALAPDVAACFANRGRAYAQLGHLEEALRDYDQALKLDPGRPATAIARADACRRLGRFEEALSDLDKAQHSGARSSDVYYHRALVYLAQEERTAAAEALSAALELDSTNEAARDLLNRLKSPR